MNKHILIVEDDLNLRETLADNLELEGYIVTSVDTVAKAQVIIQAKPFDLIILDIMLPDGNGYELCQWVRSKIDVLILMLSARNLEKDFVDGFIAGCDDYVSKPYRSTELLLRIQALLRRQGNYMQTTSTSTSISLINGFIVNWELREVKINQENIHLTKTAFDILQFLYSKQNQGCSRDDILNAVWGANVYVDNRTVDNFVSNLKKQLNLQADQEYQIKTIRGLGYSLVC